MYMKGLKLVYEMPIVHKRPSLAAGTKKDLKIAVNKVYESTSQDDYQEKLIESWVALVKAKY